MKLLLHTCCGVCLAGSLYRLNQIHQQDQKKFNIDSIDEILIYFYNPNIHPRTEYEKRQAQIPKVIEWFKLHYPSINYAYLPFPYDLLEVKKWFNTTRPYWYDGENSLRCRECFRFRLEKAFKHAFEYGYDLITTTLTISPHKDVSSILRIGKEIEAKYQGKIRFLDIIFRKKQGYLYSIKISKALAIYHQNYCGCIFSKLERMNKIKQNHKH